MNKTPSEIFLELHSKFKENFDDWYGLENHGLERTITGLHCISAIGEVLDSKQISKHHKLCRMIYDEIFSDGVSAIYLASNAMDKPANIVVRRILELGVAAIYLWDMPHEAHSWSDFDRNLSFTEMLRHVDSPGYLRYVSEENSRSDEKQLFPTSECQKIYGRLSDIVHGKVTTFESPLPDRFTFIEGDWNEFVELIERVICILVTANLGRHEIANELYKKVPTAKKEFG